MGLKIGFNKKLKIGKIYEEDILMTVKEIFPNSKIYINLEFGNQDYVIGNKIYKCPDIYSIENECDVVLRVEVKGLSKFGDFKNETVVMFPRYLFESYLRLEKEEEIPCIVIFSVGEAITGHYDYYWETLDGLNSLKKKYGREEGYNSECVYWRKSDLKRGINGFKDYLCFIKNGW